MPATVLTMPGVKTLSEPVATASSPCRMVLPEIESVSLTGALRSPGRVGVNRMKSWQVFGTGACRCGAECAAAGVACNAEVGAGGSREIDVLVDHEGERHRRALAADRSGGKDNIAVQFPRDAVAGVGEGEVAEAVDRDTARCVERSTKSGVAILCRAVGTGGTVGQAGCDRQCGRSEDVADDVVRAGLGDEREIAWARR